MKQIHVAAGLTAFLSLVCGCSDPDSPKSTAAGADGGGADGAGALDFAAFDAAMNEYLATTSLKGASAIVVRKDGGVVHAAGYGEYDADRTYLVMSSTKIVTVGVLMKLVDDGLLDLDAPIGDYLAAWGSGNGKESITVAQLVSGSSGLVGIVDNLGYAPYACQFDAGSTLSDCAKAIYTSTADAADVKAPDTEFHYGGAPWQLAGGVAEVVSGKPWSQLYAETYAKCGLAATGYANASGMVVITPGADGAVDFSSVGYPTTFGADPGTLAATENPSMEAGLYTKGSDYAKLLLLHLQGGLCGSERVLPEAAVERMREDRVLPYGSTEAQMRKILAGAEPDALAAAVQLSGYGMGWWVNREQAGVFHDPGAFGSASWIDVGRGYGAFIGIEGNVVLGAEMTYAALPALQAAFDAAR